MYFYYFILCSVKSKFLITIRRSIPIYTNSINNKIYILYFMFYKSNLTNKKIIKITFCIKDKHMLVIREKRKLSSNQYIHTDKLAEKAVQ